MAEDIASNVELMPILVGLIVSVVLILIGFGTGNSVFGFCGLIIGSAISGFLTENSLTYALIYGAIIGIISSFFVLTVFTIPLFIILGLFGSFLGNVIKAKI